MQHEFYRSYFAFPAIVPMRLAIGILTLYKWLLGITCVAAVLFTMWQMAILLFRLPHQRNLPAHTVQASRATHHVPTLKRS